MYVLFCNIAFLKKKWSPPIFSGNAIKIGVLENFEKPHFWKKKSGTTSCPFWRPPFFGCNLFFWPFFFFSSFFFLFLLHLARGVPKKPYFYRVFWHTLLKHLVTIMQQQWSEAKTHQKKGAIFFSKKPFFDHFLFSKTLIWDHPPITVHQKISKNPYFYRLKKRWPSY